MKIIFKKFSTFLLTVLIYCYILLAVVEKECQKEVESMLTERQELILKAIVEEFVDTAEPIGSKTLVETYGLNYSSATIRNEMNYLENAGYLEKTHTSSGRIPSINGYRYYVENLLQSDLQDEDKNELLSMFEADLPIEDVIQKSCDILSNMTNLTSLVLGPDANKQKLAHIRLFPLDEKNAVAVFITDQGHTENKTFHFSENVSVEDIKNCTDILNDRLVGTPIDSVVEKLNEIKPILANSVKRSEALFNAFVQAFVKFASDNVYCSGQSNMLYQPEFSDIEKLKSLMKMLENSKMWRHIGTDVASVKASSSDKKNEMIWMNDMAIISSKFTVGEEEGKLMIIGPSRMNYNKIVSVLDFVASFIENRYKKK